MPADPQRIVVLSGDELDALCALGLQSRIVAAALPDGSSSQPSYLGTVIHEVHGVGSRGRIPDLSAIRAANPDLILGSQALTPELYPSLSAIAPTVFTDAPGAGWQDNLRIVGAATGRADAADGLVGTSTRRGQGGRRQRRRALPGLGGPADRHHYAGLRGGQLPGQRAGRRRRGSSCVQRFTDKPYIEIGIRRRSREGSDFSAADARHRVHVVRLAGGQGSRAPEILTSDAWRKLSANRDNRVFVVNNEVWQTGEGIVAARGIVADLKWLNAPIN